MVIFQQKRLRGGCELLGERMIDISIILIDILDLL